MPRCPNGTRRNKKSGNCEPVAKKSTTTKRRPVKRSKKMEITGVKVTIGVSKDVENMYVIKHIVFFEKSGKNVIFDFDFTERVNMDDNRKLLFLNGVNNDVITDDFDLKPFVITDDFDLNKCLKEHNFNTMPKKFDKSLIQIALTMVYEASNEDELADFGLMFDGYKLINKQRGLYDKDPHNIDVVYRDVCKILSMLEK